MGAPNPFNSEEAKIVGDVFGSALGFLGRNKGSIAKNIALNSIPATRVWQLGTLAGTVAKRAGLGPSGGELVSDSFTEEEKKRRRQQAIDNLLAAERAKAAEGGPIVTRTVPPTNTIPSFEGWTPDAKTAYVTYGTDNSGLLDQQYGITRDWISGRKTDFQNAIAKQREDIMRAYSTEPDPMIRAMLKRQVQDLDARLAAAVPSIEASYKPAIQAAQTASQNALITARQLGDELNANYLNAAAQNDTRAMDASAALAGALGGQVASGNTSAATRDFGQFMQAMAPIQQKAAMDYGQMLSALMQTDANSSTRQQGADQAYARNLTSQLVAQAQQEAAQREYEQVQRAREQRAQALAALAAQELQGNMSFDQQLGAAMQGRNDAALQAATERNQLLQGYRLEDIKKSENNSAAALPALIDALIPWNGSSGDGAPIVLSTDRETGEVTTISPQSIRSYVEAAYRAVMADKTISPAARQAEFIRLLEGKIPQEGMRKGKVYDFAAKAFAGS